MHLATGDTHRASEVRTGSATTQAAQSSANSMMVVSPGCWTEKHEPAAATQATKSKAAAAGTRHVCTHITAILSTTDTAQSSVIYIYLRDGATGAGTILWEMPVTASTNTTVGYAGPIPNIVGTANTAMTLEFSGAGVSNSKQTVTLVGFSTT